VSGLEILIGFVIGILSGLISSTIINPPGRGKITSPHNNSSVNHNQIIEGTYGRFRYRKRYDLYLVVRPIGHARHFPQVHSGPIEPDRDGKWSAEALVGLPHEVDDSFAIALVAFDTEAKKIVDYYEECGKAHGDQFVGLRELPPGSKSLDRITVVRK